MTREEARNRMFDMGCRAIEKFNRTKNNKNCILKTMGLKCDEDIAYIWKCGLPTDHDNDMGLIGCSGIILSLKCNDSYAKQYGFNPDDSVLFHMHDSYYETDDSFEMISKDQMMQEIAELFEKKFPVYEHASNGWHHLTRPEDKDNVINKIKKHIRL